MTYTENLAAHEADISEGVLRRGKGFLTMVRAALQTETRRLQMVTQRLTFCISTSLALVWHCAHMCVHAQQAINPWSVNHTSHALISQIRRCVCRIDK